MIGVAWVTLALAAALSAPLWVLVWVPLFLGVPHVLADLRYLVSAGAPRPVVLPTGSILALAAMVLHRLGGMAGLPYATRLELVLGLVAVGSALASRETGARRASALLAASGVALLAWPVPAMALSAHLHNYTALGIWARLAPGGRAPVVVAYLGALAALAAGVADRAFAPLLADPAGLALVAPLAPGLDPVWVGRLGLSYAFAQLVHYAVWLHLVPALAPGSRSLAQDLGRVPAWLGVAAAVAVPLAGWFDPPRVRALYLGAAGFHAWLEWAVLARGLEGPGPGGAHP